MPLVWSGNVFLVRSDAPYQSLKDLKGKKIGNFSRVTGAYFFSAILAREQGLDIDGGGLEAQLPELRGQVGRLGDSGPEQDSPARHRPGPLAQRAGLAGDLASLGVRGQGSGARGLQPLTPSP